uniref:Uncharacterized protein n=1 Tax=Utricularia reniformis TaxID=192314 RepID=A0A1Y0B4Q0_9LAMI|nr:hypothetical protein AEK19_MT2222 [Utricularia reniformis]ART32368.1 hypothetical protein AEK19_MT2222 [Utricularia reniformis]
MRPVLTVKFTMLFNWGNHKNFANISQNGFSLKLH